MSITNKNSGLAWTAEAVQLFEQLVDLDSQKREDQKLIFSQLYEMWVNNGLITEIEAKASFYNQRDFIKQTIFFIVYTSRAGKNKEGTRDLQLP